MINPKYNLDMLKSSLSLSSDLPTLNDDEIKRIMLVIDRDFKLRQKESKRIEELKKVIRQEHERIEYLVQSDEFNSERCRKCYKPFKIFFNPKEICSKCKFYVCHDCATFNKPNKTWTCKICLTIKELECLTGDWFYLETSKKYKRCGSAKVVRELHKREKELTDIDELDEDFGYGTLPTSNSTDSKDSGSVISYVVHDRNIKNELNEYSKRLSSLVNNLQSDLSESNIYNKHLSTPKKNKENLRSHEQQIALEINRARTALSRPLRLSNQKVSPAYENELRNLLIQRTEKVLRTNLRQFQQNFTTQNSTNFDQALAQIIFDQCINKEIACNSSQTTDSSPTTFSQLPPQFQRQSSAPFPVNSSSFQLTRTNSSPRAINPSWEVTPRNGTIQSMSLSRTSTVDEEDDEDEITPTGSSIEDEKSDHHDNQRRFIDTDPETIKKSNERVDHWKTNFSVIQSTVVPSDDDDDDDEQVESSTWL